jgi:parallel beta-helix repeat protein
MAISIAGCRTGSPRTGRTSSPDNTIRRNTMYNNQGCGVQVYNGSRWVLVVRNIAYKNGDHSRALRAPSDAPFDVRGLTLDADPGPLHRE